MCSRDVIKARCGRVCHDSPGRRRAIAPVDRGCEAGRGGAEIVLWNVPASPANATPAVGMIVAPVPEILVIPAVPLAVAVS